MIIFGTRGVNLTKSNGQFFCPECTSERRYKEVNVRRFFTLYFIPIIPLDLLGSYVECSTCKGTYKPEILTYDFEKERDRQAQFHAEYMDAIKNVMLLIMMADGVIEESEVMQIINIYHKLTGKELDRETVIHEGENISRYGSLEQYVKNIATLLNLEGKVLVLKAAMEIAAADGEFQKEEQELIAKLNKTLELPKTVSNEVIAQYFE